MEGCLQNELNDKSEAPLYNEQQLYENVAFFHTSHSQFKKQE